MQTWTLDTNMNIRYRHEYKMQTWAQDVGMNTRYKHEHKIQTWTQDTNMNTSYKHKHKIWTWTQDKKMNAVYKFITRYKHDVIYNQKHTINKTILTLLIPLNHTRWKNLESISFPQFYYRLYSYTCFIIGYPVILVLL